MILHIFMYNVISDFSAATPASEGRVNGTSCLKHIGTYKLYQQTFTTLQWQLKRFHLRFHVFLQLKYLL